MPAMVSAPTAGEALFRVALQLLDTKLPTFNAGEGARLLIEAGSLGHASALVHLVGIVHRLNQTFKL